MKKAFDQTVRDLKREVNKVVLKVPAIEQKILDATSNEPWGPHGSLLADIAQATRNHAEFQIIMSVIWKRINDTGKNWRHVYKGLIVLDYLVAHGSERVIDEIREHSYQIATLSDFQYISSSGRDEGIALVNDKERIQEVRQKAHANRDKYRGTISTGGMHHSGSYSGSGSYGDQYDDDQYHGSYGNREDHRNGYGKDKDSGYRDDDRYGRRDSYGRDGDRYGRDGDRYGRDADDYRGNRGNDDYQFGSRNRNVDRDKGRSFDDDDRYSPRSGGGKMDGPSHEDRQLEHKFSEQNLGAPLPMKKLDGGAGQAPIAKIPPAAPKASPAENINLSQAPVVSTESHTQKEEDAFDEFDPRGSTTAAVPAEAGFGTDFFGLSGVESISSLALVPVTAPTTSEVHLPNSSDSGQNLPLPFNGFSQPGENPFGEPPFKAIPQDGNAPAQQQNNLSATPFPFPSESPSLQPSLAVGDSLSTPLSNPVNGHVPSTASEILPSGLASLQPNAVTVENLNPYSGSTYATPSQVYPPAPSGGAQPIPANILSHPAPFGLAAPQAYPSGFLPQTGLPSGINSLQSPYAFSPQGFTAAAPVPQSFPQSHFSQQGQSVPVATQATPAPTATFFHGGVLSSVGASQPDALVQTVPPAKSVQSKDKFETKSTVWADTLNRGLVDLNISGPKTNPLADIGVDFESINRKEKRKEKATVTPVSTTTMGKAMGSGSGIGRAGVVGLAPLQTPLLVLAWGWGWYQSTHGMGMGMGMNMGVGAGAQPPGGMPSGQAMRGMGYNPMAGMGGYGSQQYGGYR
ncbi:unnamed protein product [Spirodela intermedia]|uniref:ENTH domain-containing protein n=1 Tax=Spirodela intermedia TaxID=51605 RepID=A0A7I8IBP1_SPIIN|nr:unnamed protein product [Spirodela intermedia]CAA6655248.1 unnamed protein product [Spirodela intermedia]